MQAIEVMKAAVGREDIMNDPIAGDNSLVVYTTDSRYEK